MKELEEHLRSITEQVKIRRRLLKHSTEKTYKSEMEGIGEEIEQINKLIENKRYIQSKLEDDIEQYHIKINRADQSVSY
jgi:transcription elongation GreA/GreB family factor